MKKRTLIFLSLLVCTVLLAGCSCQHEWLDATCTSAKHCSKCDAAEGSTLGHDWASADCRTPKTCTRCGLSEGEPLEHTWLDATCTVARTCSFCNASEGQPLEHNWTGEATLYTAPVCSVCGAEGEPLPGYFARNSLVINTQSLLPAEYKTNTYVRPDLNTTGEFFASEVQIFESDATHRAKKGYEWRSVDILITFRDSNSGLYGTNVSCARADYYQETELKSAGKQERFTVSYNGKDYKCTAIYEDPGFYFTEDSNIFHMNCYVQVPVGYDGVVLAFYHSAVSATGLQLHEVEDTNMLLFRMA